MKAYYIQISFLIFTYLFFIFYAIKNEIHAIMFEERDKKKRFIFGIIGFVVSGITTIVYALGGEPM